MKDTTKAFIIILALLALLALLGYGLWLRHHDTACWLVPLVILCCVRIEGKDDGSPVLSARARFRVRAAAGRPRDGGPQ